MPLVWIDNVGVVNNVKAVYSGVSVIERIYAGPDLVHDAVPFTEPGSIFMFAGSIIPIGSLRCSGQEVSQATYPDLYAAIGATWNNSNGAANPAVGNFRVPFSVNSGGEPMYLAGKTSSTAVGSALSGRNETHNHTPNMSNSATHRHNFQTTISGSYNDTGNSSGITANSPQTTYTSSGISSNHTHTLTIGSQGTKAKPQTITMLICIWT